MKCTSTHELGTSSVSHSQTSSSNQSVASHASQYNSASQNTSQSPINHAAQVRDNAPPAESFNASLTPPRTVTKSVPHDTASKSNNNMGRPHSLLPALRTGGAASGGIHKETNHGQKRTASGHVKTATSSQTTSPVESLQLGHSRQTSTTSSSTQISEVGYIPMVKVIASNSVLVIGAIENSTLVCNAEGTKWLADKND